MKRLNNIVIDNNEPQVDNLWIHNIEGQYVMQFFGPNGWTTIANVNTPSNNNRIGLLVINSTSNTTVNGFAVPALSEGDIVNAYNAIAVDRRGVLITDKDDMIHLLVNQADTVGDDINIKTLYFDSMILTYTLTNQGVEITYKDI